MKRFLGMALVAAAVVTMVADTADARFGRRRCRQACCQTQCQNGCAPQGMGYNDPNMVPQANAPQPNSSYYRGNSDQPLDVQGQPRNAPQMQGRTNVQGSINQNGIRANVNSQGAVDQSND